MKKEINNTVKKSATNKRQVIPEAAPLMIDDERFEEDEKEREEAFSGEYQWKGKILQPFSFSRKSLFYQHRLAMGAPPLSEVFGDVSAFLADALRIIYLCAHDPVEYRALRSKPALLQEAMEEWGDTQVLNDGDAAALTILGFRIFNASEVNQAEAIPTSHAGESLGK